MLFSAFHTLASSCSPRVFSAFHTLASSCSPMLFSAFHTLASSCSPRVFSAFHTLASSCSLISHLDFSIFSLVLLSCDDNFNSRNSINILIFVSILSRRSYIASPLSVLSFLPTLSFIQSFILPSISHTVFFISYVDSCR